MQKNYKVFVYGSLKQGYGNHYLLEDQDFLGQAKTEKNNYIMISLGGFPAVCEDQGRFNVSGELYNIDKPTLDALDRLESNGSMYQRVERHFVHKGEVVTAWIYLMPVNIAQFYFTRVGNRRNDRVANEGDSLTWL